MSDILTLTDNNRFWKVHIGQRRTNIKLSLKIADRGMPFQNEDIFKFFYLFLIK